MGWWWIRIRIRSGVVIRIGRHKEFVMIRRCGHFVVIGRHGNFIIIGIRQVVQVVHIVG